MYWLLLFCLIETFLSPWPTLRHCFAYLSYVWGCLLGSCPFAILGRGRSLIGTGPSWLGLHRVVITMLFYSPIFLLTMFGSHIVILFLYLYGGARPRGGPAPPPSQLHLSRRKNIYFVGFSKFQCCCCLFYQQGPMTNYSPTTASAPTSDVLEEKHISAMSLKKSFEEHQQKASEQS